MNENITIDTNSLINYKNKSSKNWIKHNFILERLSNILENKSKELGDNFGNVLLLSSDRGETLNYVKKIKYKNLILVSPFRNLIEEIFFAKNDLLKVESKFEKLPFKNKQFDLIISNLCLHSINNIQKHIKNIFDLLIDGGLFICNFFGESSLTELKNSLIRTDEEIFNGIFLRTAPNLKMVVISDVISQIGFKELVSEKISYQIFYSNIEKILEDLRGLGENCVLLNKNKGLMTKNYIQKLGKLYKKHYAAEQGLKLSCDVVSICCWKNKV